MSMETAVVNAIKRDNDSIVEILTEQLLALLKKKAPSGRPLNEDYARGLIRRATRAALESDQSTSVDTLIGEILEKMKQEVVSQRRTTKRSAAKQRFM